MRPSTSSSNVTLESSVRLQHKASISGMPARSASLSVTADGHVVSGPVSSVTADMVAVFPLPTQLSRSAPPQTRQPLANTHSDEVAAPTEWNPLSPGPLSSPSSSIQSELAPIVPPTESTRVLGVAVDAHLDELADEPGDEINSKSVIAVVGGARKARGSQSSTSSSTSKGNSQTSDAGSPKQSSTALSDSGFGASASVGGGGTGKPSSLKTSSVGKVLYSRAGVSDASGTPALQAVGSGSESQLHRSTQRSGPTGSVNQLAASTTPPHAGKPRSVTISTSHVASLPSGLQQSVNISSGSFAKPLERTGQSGLLRTVTFSLLLAGQARDARLDSTTAAGAGVDLNLSVSSTLSDAQVALMRRRLTQGKQLNKAKTRMQVAVACILLVSLAFAGISCFQVFGMLELMSTGDGGVGNAHGLPMAVPVLWSLAWESVRGVGNGASAAGGGLVRSPTL
ncbi:hypothetical protein BCR44DRAFT_1441606 [Catenaria anguillulae PL171]|uniref:Transmembrane protein n=1 Tax=Catenaria anguillulae PL171 TaxID=765915 RepID=A0A1Y2HCR4_9FUNG|nr:hypothetical protein BCR44DRAFT_1441606 [Catenaria anguillulae PL171]